MLLSLPVAWDVLSTKVWLSGPNRCTDSKIAHDLVEWEHDKQFLLELDLVLKREPADILEEIDWTQNQIHQTKITIYYKIPLKRSVSLSICIPVFEMFPRWPLFKKSLLRFSCKIRVETEIKICQRLVNIWSSIVLLESKSLC